MSSKEKPIDMMYPLWAPYKQDRKRFSKGEDEEQKEVSTKRRKNNRFIHKDAVYRKALIRKDLSWLKYYLTMTPEEELMEMVEDFPEIFSWVIWQDIEVHREQYRDDIAREIYDQDWEGNLEVDSDTLREYIKQFSDPVIARLRKDIGREVVNEFRGDAPTFLFFDEPQVVKNQWMIHFTNEPQKIQQEGFTVGTDDLSRLGLTVFMTKEEKGGGYNFAYAVDDFLKNNFQYGYQKYGKYAVMFRASGLKLWHSGDKENQVIFWGADATDFVVLGSGHYTERGEEKNGWVVVPCRGTSPYGVDSIKSIIQWVVDNFEQYRKVLTCK